MSVPATEFGGGYTVRGAEGAAPLVGPSGTVYVYGTAADSGSVTEHAFLLRVASNGSLDSTFGAAGVAAFGPPDSTDKGLRINAAAVQADGKCILAGALDQEAPDGGSSQLTAVLVRVGADGSVDSTFGQGGFLRPTVSSQIEGVAVENDGTIVVAFGGGSANLARFNSDGSADTSFGSAGYVASTPFGVLALQNDGTILVSGADPTTNALSVAHYTSAGVLDSGFGSGGRATLGDLGARIVAQPDSKILVGGATSVLDSHPYLAVLTRLQTNGAVDPGFGSGGIVESTVQAYNLTGLGVEQDGSIFIATDSTLLARFDSTGTFDTGFKVSAGANIDGGPTLAIQPDGKILVAGVSSNEVVVARILP